MANRVQRAPDITFYTSGGSDTFTLSTLHFAQCTTYVYNFLNHYQNIRTILLFYFLNIKRCKIPVKDNVASVITTD